MSPVKEKSLLVILGNQLFPYSEIKKNDFTSVYMAEDYELCTYEKFHKHKIIFFLAAMRHHADELIKKKLKVHYVKLKKTKKKYEQKLLDHIKDNKINKVLFYEIEDKFLEKRFFSIFKKNKIEFEVIRSPMFLCTREDFKDYLDDKKKPFMKSFYEQIRCENNILMETDESPIGGKYSFDSENRKKLPKDIELPKNKEPKIGSHEKDVIDLVDEHFKDHPGECGTFWLGTTRRSALKSLNDFLDSKIIPFGPYQDALSTRGDFLFHSILSPYINCGLITPKEVVDKTVKGLDPKKIPDHYSSIEGFVRQIIGWREFIRGIYQNFSEKQEKLNFFKHKRKLKPCWYDGDTGLLPLDLAIQKSVKTGYAHHIERLMVLGNLMVLCEVEPEESHRWFMEMFIDSSDWVMGPNVYGMALFSDGGLFATKPYICGANYIKKMSDYPKGEWEQELTSLYWRFVGKNIEYLRTNIRCVMITKIYDRFSDEKKESFQKIGDQVIQRITD